MGRRGLGNPRISGPGRGPGGHGSGHRRGRSCAAVWLRGHVRLWLRSKLWRHRDLRVLLLGLDAAGKSTLLQRLRHGDVVELGLDHVLKFRDPAHNFADMLIRTMENRRATTGPVHVHEGAMIPSGGGMDGPLKMVHRELPKGPPPEDWIKQWQH